MPTITVRVSEQERAGLERDAKIQGVTLSELVRSSLGLKAAEVLKLVEDLDTRVAILEGMAGLR